MVPQRNITGYVEAEQTWLSSVPNVIYSTSAWEQLSTFLFCTHLRFPSIRIYIHAQNHSHEPDPASSYKKAFPAYQ